MADVTQSPKQGYQWPHEKDLCPLNFFLKMKEKEMSVEGDDFVENAARNLEMRMTIVMFTFSQFGKSFVSWRLRLYTDKLTKKYWKSQGMLWEEKSEPCNFLV